MTNEVKQGMLIVLSGPSGVGKSTVIRELLKRRPDIFFSVSYTTRQPRDEDVPGKTYHFVTREEFERMIGENEFLEYAQFVGNYYGTSLKVIRDHQQCGEDVLLDIEVQGARQVREKCPDAVTIFLFPPSLEDLERRLRDRKTDSEEAIQGRLKQARIECREAVNYEYLVVNDAVEEAVNKILSILKVNSLKVERNMDLVKSIAAEDTD